LSGNYSVGQRVRLRGTYWTAATELTEPVAEGALTIRVRSTTGYANGDQVIVNPGGRRQEKRTVSGMPTAATITLGTALDYAHAAGEDVGKLVTPSVAALKMKRPDGSIPLGFPMTHPGGGLTEESTGQLIADTTLDDDGAWLYRFEASGTLVCADKDVTIYVERSTV
jgi:hypothetical protein